MFKSLLAVFAVLAVASAGYIASPVVSTYGAAYPAAYSGYAAAAYPTAYSGYAAAAYPAYTGYSAGYSTYGAAPYAYSGLGSSYLYR